MTNVTSLKFHSEIVDLLQSARQQVLRTVNKTMVITYFEIGRMIVEEEQNGKERATYGKSILKELSKVLTKEFGKGFSVQNIERMRSFFLVYQKSSTVSRKFKNEKTQTISYSFNLSWSHYLTLIRIDDQDERKFYEIESEKNNWSVRELKRQYDTALYTRLVLSRDKEEIKELSSEGQVLQKPKDAIKDPYILEFIGLPENSKYSETDLEQKIIDKLEHFLL